MTEQVEIPVGLDVTGEILLRDRVALAAVDHGAEVAPFVDAVAVDAELLAESVEVGREEAGRRALRNVEALAEADDVAELVGGQVRLGEGRVDRLDILVAAALIGGE